MLLSAEKPSLNNKTGPGRNKLGTKPAYTINTRKKKNKKKKRTKNPELGFGIDIHILSRLIKMFQEVNEYRSSGYSSHDPFQVQIFQPLDFEGEGYGYETTYHSHQAEEQGP